MKFRKRALFLLLILSIQICAFLLLWKLSYPSTDKSFVPKIGISMEDQISKWQGDYKLTMATRCKLAKRPHVDCEGIFRGDTVSLNHAKVHKRPPIPAQCCLQNLVNDCDLLIEVHRYFDYDVAEEEKLFPLAFTIKMHKSPNQAEQLLRSIYRRHNVYCIYVDLKAGKGTFSIMQRLSRCFSNIHLVEDRDRLVYSSIDLVKAELQCMRKLMDTNVRWKYYINLSGQEFPLRTNLEIVKILQNLKGANDVESYKFSKSMEKRYKTVYKVNGQSIVPTNQNKKPFRYKLSMRKGSAYGIFRYEFIQFILSDDIVMDFITWLYDTYAPEESVFSTLNTLPWAPGGYDFQTRHDKETYFSRAVLWRWDKVKCHGKYVRSVCIFGIKDLTWLGSRPEIIANKLDTDFDSIAIDCLEERLRNRTKVPGISYLNWYYYNNLPQRKLYASMNETSKSLEYLLQQKLRWVKERKQ